MEGLKIESFLQHVQADVKAGSVTHVIIELCTSLNAGLSQGIGSVKSGHCVVVPVSKEIDLRCVHKLLHSWLVQLKKVRPETFLLAWTSPPCTGGSPVLNLIPQPRRAELQEGHLKDFEGLLLKSHPIVSVCDLKILEMSQKCSYWRNESVQAFCRFHGLKFIVDVARCAYVGEQNLSALHRYRFVSNQSMFMPKLGEYPKALAVSIVKWFSSL